MKLGCSVFRKVNVKSQTKQQLKFQKVPKSQETILVLFPSGDVENKSMNTMGEKGRRGRMNWEIVIDIYTLLILCIK